MTTEQQSNNPNYTDQTIQWARESLQRRRKELQAKKKSLVASYKQSSSTSSNDDYVNVNDDRSQTTIQNQQQEAANDVNAMLEKGRALLAEAEAHSEILGRYASPSSKLNEKEDDDSSTRSSSTRDDFMSRSFLHEANNNDDATTNDEQQLDSNNNSTTHNDNDRIIPTTLPVEMPAWDKEFSSDGELVENTNNNTNTSNIELQELLQEGEARARLDELIANVRRQGDDKRYATELLDAHNNNNTPTKKISTFDPSSMYAARRAELKKMKFDEEVAAAEEEARALSSFKALPLPGGVQVKNNPFASTQSFEMKQVGSVDKLVRRDSKLNDHDHVHNKTQQQNESSSVCSTFGSGAYNYNESTTTKISGSHYNNNNTVDTSFTNYSDSYANEEDRERAKQLRTEKKMKKKQLLEAVNQTIMADDMQRQQAEGDDAISTTTSHIDEGCYDIVEDPSKLCQDIARLEAKLKQKKTQRLAILNDIVDIDLDAPFDRLLSGSGSGGDDNDGIRNIIDRLKKQVCGSVNDFQDVNTSLRNDDEINSYEQQEQHTRASLFERQEEWARQREQKLFEARLQSEANAMQGITGRPQLSHAARSWKKAKDSHDTTLKRCVEIEERKQQEKEAKDKATNELKMKELEELQRQASLSKLNKSSSIKNDNVNKEEQMKRLEMLSKPRQSREPHNHHGNGASELEDRVSIDKKTTSEIFGGSLPKPNKQKPIKPFFSKSLDNRVIKTVHDVLSSSALGTSVNDVKERPDELFHGKHSFSDMSDKEFAKLVRRIEKRAAVSSSAKMMKKELDK